MVLCEKENEVGGILIGEQAIPFKHEMYKLGVTLGTIAEKEGVDIRLNTAVDASYAEELDADVVIIAAGSEPFVPDIKGIDSNNVILINDYHHHVDEVKESVVVLGGGSCRM